MPNPVVTIKDLKYRYRDQKRNALDDINLELNEGDFLVIMGPSEAGKSTLAATFNGLVPHFFKGKFKGDVQIFGRNTRDFTVAEMAKDVGMVFQDFEAQLFSTNVELEIAFGPENFGVPPAEISRRIDENLKLVGLEQMKNRPPSTLSGGQKQKLAIASVLAMQPRVLVMDEPTTDLDPISKLGVFKIADELRKRDDLTLIVVEHETEEAIHAGKILLIKEGMPLMYGPAADVLRNVDLMESNGVMPLGITLYFKRMNSADLPLTVEEGFETFQRKNWKISSERYQKLIEADQARVQAHKEPLITCKGLEHTYPNGFKALRGMNLEINRGEIVAIVGQNGSGKTTLVKHFNGLFMPTAGEIKVDGKPTREQGVFELGKKVGYVFQNPDHQIFSDTVFEEVAYSLKLRGADEELIKQRVAEALEAVGLVGFEKEDPFALTKSGRQRVAVAAVLAAKPDVLILDEPTTGLDYAEQRSMMELVKHLNQEGSTIIFVTHHMWVVAEYAHRVYVVKDGLIMLEGTPREVFAHEEELNDAFLRPPHLVSLSNRLGKTMLNVDEMVECTLTDGEEA
ncbi:cobalt ABC transporter ATP-binding protein [Ornatilinea apprima]|uniref:Cobalt ABC transporter ATP-binding protein n=1 Tax=Ornatilinea apprima TaxID=1134406 RepID=A0A0P6XM69_9CHLR|nr:ABC transporter ATP-binding protein [Ornatilinea apprima]KPL70009.1 cobalt ABC transporter ATP-binding protein [Ornatilinea apprima]